MQGSPSNLPTFSLRRAGARSARLVAIITVMLCATGAGVLHAQDGRLEISRLGGSFYVYTTYRDINGVPFPSNSMYVVTTAGVVMIDTPWDTTQTAPLLDSIERRHGKPVVLCIVTHSHDDRTGGLDVLNARGIATWSTYRTDTISRQKGEKLATHHFNGDSTFRVGGITFETWYPGEGHTVDNIVVWFPRQKILYGGCLIKSVESQGLGNVADANLSAWPRTMKNLKRRYGRPRHIVTGHQEWRSRRSIDHTILLLKEAGR